MDLELKGKTGLVMAGSQGLGRAIAESWAAEGVSVAVMARSEEALVEVAKTIRSAGGTAVGIVGDLSDPASLDAALAKARAELGAIDMLLLNTGGPAPTKPTGVPIEVWEQQFHTLLTPMVRTVEALLADMRARKFGRIMYIAAPGLIMPSPYTTVSQSMRLAVAAWLKVLAGEVAADGVTVNTLIPGVIETARLYSLAKSRAEMEGVTLEETLAGMVAAVPAGRLGTPREFAAVATFLASPLAAYVTGSIHKVDGGWISAL